MDTKQHSKVLVDTYSTTNGSLKVLGRYSHVSSTETDIEKKIYLTLEDNQIENPLYIQGFDLMENTAEYDPQTNAEIQHITASKRFVFPTPFFP